MPLPQTPLELVAGQIDWAHKNINNNLDFVPDDKLNWKPAPAAKSVLEIINHATGTVHAFTHAITGSHHHDLTPATNRDEAKALLAQVVQTHQTTIAALTPSQLEEMVETPVGQLPKAMAAALPVIELVNHHGQITYLQTLLGDSESHLIIG